MLHFIVVVRIADHNPGIVDRPRPAISAAQGAQRNHFSRVGLTVLVGISPQEGPVTPAGILNIANDLTVLVDIQRNTALSTGWLQSDENAGIPEGRFPTAWRESAFAHDLAAVVDAMWVNVNTQISERVLGLCQRYGEAQTRSEPLRASGFG